MNIKQYVKRNNIKVEVTRDHGTQVEGDGGRRWEHHAYTLRMVWQDGALSRTMEDIPWKQGLAIETSPTDEPWGVLDALVSDASAYNDADSFEDFCDNFGYDHDSRSAERQYIACGEIAKKLTRFLGSTQELERLTYKVERL